MTEWISVKDRLPREIVDSILVARNEGIPSVMAARYMDGEFVVWNFGMKETFKDPTHWRPLPEPPDAE